MFEKYYDLENIRLRKCDNVDCYPRASERSKWEGIPEGKKMAILKKAEKYLDYQYPALLACNYYKLYTEDSRDPYMVPYYHRREVLTSLVLAECVEYKGRFVNDIINGIYLVCEESTWVDPAHSLVHYAVNGGPRDQYPNVESQMIDLSAGATAIVMAWIYYLLKKELDSINPLICRYVEYAVNHKILNPFLDRDDIWWMRFNNNWTTGLNHEIIETATLLEKEDSRLKDIFRKSMYSMDYYYSTYPFDGGCEEGTSYWHGNMGSDYLEWLQYATYGSIAPFDNQQLKNIAMYEYYMYVGKNNYVAVSDSHMNFELEKTERLYTIAKLSKAEELKIMASHRGMVKSDEIPDTYYLPDLLKHLFHADIESELEKYKNKEIKFTKSFWYDSIETAIWRERDTEGGLFFTIKGGNNGEIHNHNDVGNFALFYDCEPVILDAGIGEYSNTAFSPLRYTLWEFNSKYHNVPYIGGIEQKDGRKNRAINVNHTENSVTMDIAPAYADNRVKSWIRNVEYDRNRNEINFEEDYELETESEISLHFLTSKQPQIEKDRIRFHKDIELIHTQGNASYEEIIPLYPRIKEQYGRVFRIKLVFSGKLGKFKYTIRKIHK